MDDRGKDPFVGKINPSRVNRALLSRMAARMTSSQTGSGGMSSDLKILIAAIVIGVMSLLMVVAGLVGHLNTSQEMETLSFWSEVGASAVIFATIVAYAPLALKEMGTRRQLARSAVADRHQIEQLFKMTDMLQSASDYADANAVLRATAAELLPAFGGALYVFNNSRDRLDLSTCWEWSAGDAPSEAVAPAHCWALKRGKPHLNLLGPSALRCSHHPSEVIALEIPMMARGEVYGLLMVQTNGPGAADRLRKMEPLATAIADAMSLALSNIALREKLRTQALRDPLTGLYNRRYMEDVLERYSNLAERNGSALSAIMIDLDHFKLLNDEHGHALGDAVLREAAAAIAGAIRPSDVACRYGGEELLVLLADCGLDEAVVKAELLRARIESLSEIHGMRITASFGVATAPETSAKGADIIPAADVALYRAKQAGRNRVEAASRRHGDGTVIRLNSAAE
jgi:diguanylate cyclase (GGDEF)-like protein